MNGRKENVESESSIVCQQAMARCSLPVSPHRGFMVCALLATANGTHRSEADSDQSTFFVITLVFS